MEENYYKSMFEEFGADKWLHMSFKSVHIQKSEANT